MPKLTIIILSLLSMVSCHQPKNKFEFNKDLKGKTFSIINSSIQQDFEFGDSTTIMYSLMKFEAPYDFKKINDTLVRVDLDGQTGIVTKTLNSKADYMLIGERLKDTILLKQLKKRSDWQLIKGKWIDERGVYEITDDAISYKSSGSLLVESPITFDSSRNYISFDLYINSNETEKVWRIKKLNEKTLIIDKLKLTTEGWTTIENITLKKNVS